MDDFKNGLHIGGILMNKNIYTPKDQSKDVRYTLDIAVPGNRDMIPLSVSRDLFTISEEMENFSSLFSISSYKGMNFFTAIE